MSKSLIVVKSHANPYGGEFNMYDLIDYLNKGRCLVFIGSGPSCEVGLPSWRGLAENFLESIRKKDPADLDDYEILFAQQKYSELFGRAWRKISSTFVLDIVRAALTDTNRRGAIYDFLVDFGFHGYLTTNLESLLKRHFTDQGIAAVEYTNAKSQLEQVDFDVARSIVKVHGELKDPSTLVLTDEQYEKVMFDSSFEHLRVFLSGHLTTSRIVFVGYSLKDPDLQYLVQLSRYALRRKTPLFAVIANASQEDCDEWDRKFNIRVVPYRNPDGRHAELRNLFEAVRRYVALRNEPPPPSSRLSLQTAQSLFMWHRFQQQTGQGARVDAFKSLVLASLPFGPDFQRGLDVAEIASLVAKRANMNSERIKSSVSQAVRGAVGEGLLDVLDGERFRITAKGYELNRKYSDQFGSLQKEFLEQVELDFRRLEPGISPGELEKVKGVVVETIISAFTERGAEIVQMVFSHDFELRPTSNLFKIINSRAQLLDPSGKYIFINYVTELLTRPRGVHERFLAYLSKVFLTVQALDLDPDGSRLRRALLSNHALVVDSNVLIPALAINSVNNRSTIEILDRTKGAGLRLIVTPRLFDETLSHLSWAQNLIDTFGEQSIEVFSAALGRGHYRHNAFLDGYIRYCTDVKKVDWPSYLENCFEGVPDAKTVRNRLNKLGIAFFGTHPLASKDATYFVIREDTAKFIRELREARPDVQKTEERIETEAEVYAAIYLWGVLKPDNVAADDWNCSFLTYSTFLNRLVHEGLHQLQRNIIVRPDVLYEFVGRLAPSGDVTTKFEDVMLATYFRSAEYFIDKKKYAKFFSPLLKNAEEIYNGSLETFRRVVSSSLTADSLQEVEELERPFAIVSLTAQVDETLRAEVNRLADENEALRKEVAKRSSRASRRRAKRNARH